VLSHRSAAALWELRSTARASVDVTALRRTRHKRPGIDVHRVRKLMATDTTRRGGMPVTTVARTLLDLAEVVPQRDLDRAFEEADRIGLLDMRAVEAVCRRNPGRHGLKQLRRITAMHRGEAPHTRSELERCFLELCHDTGLPRPAVNVVVAGFEVDAVWRKERLVVEIDGYAFHRSRSAFERDRVRDAALQLAGYRVLRVTHRRLEAAPTTVAETLRSMLAGLSLQQA
jgi:hypothetical protein